MLYPNARSKCYKKGGAVNIVWDAITGVSDQYESIQQLLKSKWNMQTMGARRMDMDLNENIS